MIRNLALRWFCLTILILTVLFSAAAKGSAEQARWVVDGDTIVLTDGRHVRYIGIDTPEIDRKAGRAEPMGKEAWEVNRRLVEGKPLRLVFDRQPKDRYGRWLAYVYRSDDGLMVNAELARRGVAHVLYRFPNTRKADFLLDAQREAMRQGRGIWRNVDRLAALPRELWGNRRSKRFHTVGCPLAKDITPRHRIRLDTPWQAFWMGYAPAQECISFPQ